ncbi:GGDEF domain-containing protein (plasmid) [Ralstonia wenshanensis]|uniref:sensor domain-containing diguanylate cyclase n=2 Tax=Ralstonia TaxID=48736 RepID=UPI001E5B1F51|nr:sensor domain-containing diguanylate cyclase [Ralstonia wenshanensis]UGS88837.1 GGDEF domain-containing protein [Ralstonia wenshanensis]
MTETVQVEGVAPSRPELFIAAAVSVAIVALAAFAFSAARLQWPEVRPFLPIFLTTVVLFEGLTGYLLLQRARLAGDPFYGALAGAYVFAAAGAAAQLPTFPGVFSEAGLLGAGSQTAVWLWTFWHSGFPLLVLLAGLSRRLYQRAQPQTHTFRGVRAARWVGPIAATIVVPLSIWGTSALPQLIQGGTYANLVDSLGVPVIGANVAALVGYVALTRLRRSVDVWVCVALLASLADAVLTLQGGARYTVGWYAARVLSVLSSGVVLSMLIAEITRLYRALINANRRLEKQALLDGLTQIANRQAFDTRWETEWRRAERDGTPLSVLMIDIDHFKRINDTFGHGRGDAYLVAVASILSGVATQRGSDFVARYGGEEFVVLLPGTERAGAQQVAERVRSDVEVAALPAPSAGRVVTVSIGVATYTPTEHVAAGQAYQGSAGRVTAEVLARADMALYDAKRAGRNAVSSR